MTITLVILFITTDLFLWGKLRSGVVRLLALPGLNFTVTGILTPTEAIADLSNPIVLMLAGLFVI